MTEGWRRQYYIEKHKLHCKIDDFAAKAFREYKVREFKSQRVQRSESANGGNSQGGILNDTFKRETG